MHICNVYVLDSWLKKDRKQNTVMQGYCDAGILGCRDTVMQGYWDAGILGCRHTGMQGYCDAGIL